MLKSNGFGIDTLGLTTFDVIKSHKKQGFLLSDDGMPKMIEGRGDFCLKQHCWGLIFYIKITRHFF